MAAFAGRKEFGLYPNGQAQSGTNFGFTRYNHTNDDALSGDGCFVVDYNAYGSTARSDVFVPVDTSKYYIHGVSVKTYQRSYNNRLGSGHLGFACYDDQYRFIDLRQCGGLGNTFLSRPANPGDSIIYFQSSSDWYTGADVTNQGGFRRHIIFFPPDHPEFSRPHEYSRLNNRSYYRMEQTDQGDWAVYLSSYLGSGTGIQQPATLPDYGYSLPAGTPVSRGNAGGSYNYCHGAPTYDEEWETFTTEPFTGESRNSSLPFRYGTKFIKFLNLRNYNYRAESSGDSARYYIDNIFLLQVPPPSPVQETVGANFRQEFNISAIRDKIASIRKFKRRIRGGQRRSDFFS